MNKQHNTVQYHNPASLHDALLSNTLRQMQRSIVPSKRAFVVKTGESSGKIHTTRAPAR